MLHNMNNYMFLDLCTELQCMETQRLAFFPELCFPLFPRIMYRPSQTVTDEGSIKHPWHRV